MQHPAIGHDGAKSAVTFREMRRGSSVHDVGIHAIALVVEYIVAGAMMLKLTIEKRAGD